MNNVGLDSNTRLLKTPEQMLVHFSQSTTCGNRLYYLILALTGWPRQLQAPVSQMSAAGADISVTHFSPEIVSSTVDWEYALFKVENTT